MRKFILLFIILIAAGSSNAQKLHFNVKGLSDTTIFLAKYLGPKLYYADTVLSKDGSLDGPPFTLYKKILKKYPHVNMITGGGIRNMNDIEKLEKVGVKNIIFGRAFYDGNISLDDLKNFYKR